ncbi:hypothetical protein EDC94DRAFT_619549 [Helicostylum pulchrum]|nr:hypothetical protein EDC94DRAFT_619549 [Helicostylum pulchrum]
MCTTKISFFFFFFFFVTVYLQRTEKVLYTVIIQSNVLGLALVLPMVQLGAVFFV